MKYAKNILETIGNTPLVQLNKVVEGIDALVLAKVETFNPGNSVKDRMAVKMVEDAEADGRLKPGGTIIEGTSGNTGMGLALVAIVKGYKCIFVISDKQSKEKMDILRAVGAEVIVCPTDVEPTDPRSYYSVSKRLATEIPNSWYVNQYDNPSNALAHYEQTGPEIWEQTEGKITHFVVGVGTGGTISGVGKYLKEKNPNIKIWGIDTYGSVFKKYHETGIFDENEIYSYITEGLHQLKEHFKPEDVVVVLFHDSGSRYVGKMFNDDWMRQQGFLDETITNAHDLIKDKMEHPLIICRTEELVSHAIARFKKYNIAQLPVIDISGFVGSIDEAAILESYSSDKNTADRPIKELMGKPFPIVQPTTSVAEISKLITKENQAVLVALENGKFQIITKHDIISTIK